MDFLKQKYQEAIDVFLKVSDELATGYGYIYTFNHETFHFTASAPLPTGTYMGDKPGVIRYNGFCPKDESFYKLEKVIFDCVDIFKQYYDRQKRF